MVRDCLPHLGSYKWAVLAQEASLHCGFRKTGERCCQVGWLAGRRHASRLRDGRKCTAALAAAIPAWHNMLHEVNASREGREHSSSPASQNSHRVFLKGAFTACLVIWGADCVRFATAISLTVGGSSCCSRQCRGSAIWQHCHGIRLVSFKHTSCSDKSYVGVGLPQQPWGAACRCKATTAVP